MLRFQEVRFDHERLLEIDRLRLPAVPRLLGELAARGVGGKLALFDRAGDRLPEVAPLGTAMKQ